VKQLSENESASTDAWVQLKGFYHNLASGYLPIAYKLALVFTLLTTAGMVLLGMMITRDQAILMEQQMNEFGGTVSKQMAESAKEGLLTNDELALSAIANNVISNDRILGAAVFSYEYQAVVRAGLVPADNAIEKGSIKGRISWRQSSKKNAPLASYIAPVKFRDLTLGYALVTFDHSLQESAQQQTVQAVFGATVILVLVGVVGSILLGKRLTRPLYQLMDASKEVSEGNYSFRFNEQRKDELGSLMQSMNTMFEGLQNKERVEETFSRYVSSKVAKEVLAASARTQGQIKGKGVLGGHHANASVLFADIVGFTSMSENMAPQEVSSLLNEYFTYITKAAHAFNGHIDKFMGDCAMVVFGAPEEDKEHSFHAVACAVLIQRFVKVLNARRIEQGLFPVQFGIGVNSGEMLAGNMGSVERMEYTVLGDAVNLASRLASIAGGEQIIISRELFSSPALKGRIAASRYDTVRLRGKKEPVMTYRVTDITGKYPKKQ